MRSLTILAAFGASTLIPSFVHAVSSQTYTWKNVKIGGGGGFVPGIVFNPTEKVYTLLILLLRFEGPELILLGNCLCPH